VLIDASGAGTVVGRHLGTRRNFGEPELQKVAYFAHFENVERLAARARDIPESSCARKGGFG
jgi:hypothetical protein